MNLAIYLHPYYSCRALHNPISRTSLIIRYYCCRNFTLIPSFVIVLLRYTSLLAQSLRAHNYRAQSAVAISAGVYRAVEDKLHSNAIWEAITFTLKFGER
ncbi:hypothetical protein J6590_032737 [Homalodisca vitripennis]|nr:hypothetical protein J6590_032737 [Homalodisca vitripennis]